MSDTATSPIMRTAREASRAVRMRVSDGTRTRDHLDHNQVLYQLSYTHQDVPRCETVPV